MQTLPNDGHRLSRKKLDQATLLCIEEHSLPVVRFAVAVRGGSLADPLGASGSTRMLMELSLRGTKNRPRSLFNAELERLGSSLHTATGTDAAIFRGATLRRHFSSTMELLADAITRPALDTDELDTLVAESVATLRAERDEDDVVAELFLRRALYPDHPLSRSPQGEVAGLSGLTGTAIAQQYAACFGRHDPIFAFAGDIEPDQAAKEVEPMLAGLPEAADSSTPEKSLPVPDRLRILVVDKPERSQVQLRLAHPGLPGADPDVIAFWLGVMAFGGTFTSPFTHEVREVRGWSYFASADFDRRGRRASPLVFRSAPSETDAVDCLKLELDLYRQLARGEVPRETLEFARSYLLNRFPFDIATPASMLGPAIRHELLGWPPEVLFELPERLQAIDLDRVSDVMRRCLNPDALVVVAVAEAKGIVPRLRETFPSCELDVVDYREGLALEGHQT